MNGIPQPIIKVAEKYNLKLPQTKKDMSGDFWCIGNNYIIFHDALTKIAKQEGIVFHKPDVEILYNDNNLSDAKTSIALEIIMQPIEKTLNEDEIKILHALLKSIETLNKKVDSKLDFFDDFQKYMKESIEK